MISILIPTYNYNIYPLVETLHKQCVRLDIVFEIYVIEDASTKVYQDNTKVSVLSNTYYTLLESNVGRTKTRNLLAEKANYDWLLFLDADTMPVKDNFIETYLDSKGNHYSVIFGGIEYSQEKPKKDYLLRWVYGNKREVKSVYERNRNPFYIISQNLFIEKKIFLKVNKHLDNKYGMDNIFSYCLQENNSKVKHLDNPVYHHGLEKSTAFLKKSIAAIETLIEEESKNNISHDFTSLQKFYLKLKKMQLHIFVNKIISPFLKKIELNLFSEKPRIFLLDLYKLQHYITLKHGK